MTSLMMQSILEQPEAISRLLSSGLGARSLLAEFHRRSIRKIWILGSGTSLFAAMIAASAWEEEIGIDCEAVSSLEFLDSVGTSTLAKDVMVVAISQSGASLILLEGIERAKAAGALTAVVTAHPEAPIPLATDFVIETHTGPEVNMGKAKGFTTTALAAVLLGRAIALGASADADDILRTRYAALPETFAKLIEASRNAAGAWVEEFKSSTALYVVGAGTQVPTALEGALKVLEVAKMPVIAKELEEMMHGPFNGVGPDTGLIFVADQTSDQRISAFIEGVKLVGIPFRSVAATAALSDKLGPFELVLPSCDDAAVRAILGVVPFQLLAHDLAATRNVPIDTARYPQLYPVFASKSIHR